MAYKVSIDNNIKTGVKPSDLLSMIPCGAKCCPVTKRDEKGKIIKKYDVWTCQDGSEIKIEQEIA